MGTLSTPFWCLCQKLSLSPLYFNKTLLHKSSERSSLEFFFSGGQESWCLRMIQQQPFNRTWLPSPVTSITGCVFALAPSLHSFWSYFSTDLPWGSSLSVLSFCLFMLFMGFSKQEFWSGLPFSSPVDHVLSELSTMTWPSWVALHGMAHSFIELDEAVVHVINLISFLWLWFSFCLPCDR